MSKGQTSIELIILISALIAIALICVWGNSKSIESSFGEINLDSKITADTQKFSNLLGNSEESEMKSESANIILLTQNYTEYTFDEFSSEYSATFDRTMGFFTGLSMADYYNTYIINSYYPNEKYNYLYNSIDNATVSFSTSGINSGATYKICTKKICETTTYPDPYMDKSLLTETHDPDNTLNSLYTITTAFDEYLDDTAIGSRALHIFTYDNKVYTITSSDAKLSCYNSDGTLLETVTYRDIDPLFDSKFKAYGFDDCIANWEINNNVLYISYYMMDEANNDVLAGLFINLDDISQYVFISDSAYYDKPFIAQTINMDECVIIQLTEDLDQNILITMHNYNINDWTSLSISSSNEVIDYATYNIKYSNDLTYLNGKYYMSSNSQIYELIKSGSIWSISNTYSISEDFTNSLKPIDGKLYICTHDDITRDPCVECLDPSTGTIEVIIPNGYWGFYEGNYVIWDYSNTEYMLQYDLDGVPINTDKLFEINGYYVGYDVFISFDDGMPKLIDDGIFKISENGIYTKSINLLKLDPIENNIYQKNIYEIYIEIDDDGQKYYSNKGIYYVYTNTYIPAH